MHASPDRSAPEFKYSIPVFAILIAVTGSFFRFLYPVPLLAGITWFTWWVFKRFKNRWSELIARLALPTALGLSFVLLVQLVLNFAYAPASDSLEIPPLLLKLDDSILWLREHFSRLEDMSLLTWLFILISLVFLAICRPRLKPVSRFIYLVDLVEKILMALVVITSFTFFAPASADRLASGFYHNHYRVLVREKLKQERKSLIADELLKELRKRDSPFDSVNISRVRLDMRDQTGKSFNIPREAKRDADSVIKFFNARIKKDSIRTINVEATDAGMEKKWEDKAEAWGKESSEGKDEFYMKNSSGRTLLPYLEEELWRKERRNFIDAEYTEVKKATGAAGEAMEALKAFCSAILGTHIPFGDTVFGKYLEEFVSELFSSGIEKSEIPDFVSSIFLDKELGHLNLFSNIGRAEEPIEWKGRVRIHNDNSLLDSRVHEKVDDIHPEEW